jgi:formamidopyrimidine-DNA glycosylase
LPEIETLARKLRKTLIGKRIIEVQLSGLPLRKPVAESFASNLRGRTIRKILRRGKYIIAELEPKAFWLIHLGMSGRLRFQKPQSRGSKHIHAVVRFSDSTGLEYQDPRRFGLLATYEVFQLSQIPEISSLGMDPLDPGFNDKWLGPMLHRSRQDIKSFLLDQHRIAGLGNIYVCEALFHARIHPARRCHTLDPKETSRLVQGIRRVIRSAIRRRGTSFSDFLDVEGKPGENQNYLKVFQRDGEKCAGCPAPVQRIRQGNRSTYLCSNCQK